MEINHRYWLKIQLIDETMRPYYINHKSAYIQDSGVDLFISQDIIIPPKSFSNKISLGIKLEMIDLKTSHESPYLLVARSSIYKTCVRLSQSVSVIDIGFREELFLFLDNLSDNPVHFEKGTRLIQVIAPSLDPIIPSIQNSLSIGIRGTNGLGSSGLSKL
jgi:dUTP pyrophosphatase